MTTIATDGRLMAGDGRATRGDIITDKTRRKVFKLPDGSIVGAAGRSADAEAAVRTLMELTDEDVRGDYTLMRLMPDGKLTLYEGSLRKPIRVKAPMAIGSGTEAAMAAMLAGADAYAAVKIATQLDIYSGGKITSFSR